MEPTTTNRVPRALPPGLDYFRFLILLGEAAAIASILVYVARDLASLAQEPLLLALAALGPVGAAWILIDRRPIGYLASASLVAAFPLVGMLSIMRLHLLDPLSGRNFIGALLALLSILLALPAGIHGRRRALRGEHTPIPRGWRTRHGAFVIGATCLVLGAAYGGGVASIAATTPAGAAADFAPEEVGADQVVLQMADFDFQPSTLDLTAGRLARLTLENRGAELHTFTYEKAGREYNHNVPPGTNATVWLHFPEPGTVRFRCVPHSDDYDDLEDMVGVIHVAASTT